ncbi:MULTISPECIES: Ca2+-dependent phosphoinositide-specific phospholipase C [Pseudoalteromonas]|uniref:Ca2+-dependent phosphoinositide-specific phospholipase C n=1 Tax=Pseudoalteromonas TaxID=53246 RepID=UPI00030F59CC|nr:MULTISPECIES: Ca2+-dependent phosphoinositide-specific phospholipase C [Pseudoalteromonas]MCF6144269.1 hypothetical protein [Pseudoalteromonas mariniglutinosa NCIMB 1770]
MKLNSMTLAALALTASSAVANNTAENTLKINQIQVVGTHNSYSQFVEPKLLTMFDKPIEQKKSEFINNMSEEQFKQFQEEHPNPIGFAEGLNYSYDSLTEQLDAGMRSLAIDIYRDPEGGKFLKPAGYELLKSKGVPESTLLPHDKTDLDKPGLKVLHVADFDFRSNCNLFTSCLQELADWSNTHPDHAPIFIMLEAKGRSVMKMLPGAAKILPFEQSAYTEMDNSIIKVLGKNKVITPDDVRGNYKTLEQAVKANNWPSLADSKGKFVFLLIAAGDTSDLANYIEGRPNLEGRMAFLRSTPGQAHSAFILFDNAIVRQQEIQDFVKQGYLVRTRSDIETYEAKVNDMTRAKAAFSSGAQIISTDFYKSGNPYGTTYKVHLPLGAEYLCNPVNAKCE